MQDYSPPGASDASVVDRLKSLSARIQATKRALEAQEKRLDALRSCAKDLKSAAARPAPLAAAPMPAPAPRAAAPAPIAEPAFVAARATVAAAAGRPRIALPSVEADERIAALRRTADVTFYPDTTPSLSPAWLRFAPYAAIALVALAAAARVPWKSISLKDHRVSFAQTAQAATLPAPALAARPASAPAYEPVDERTFDEVLQLVYGYVPPGGRETVIDLLGPEIDSAPAASPWVIETGERPGSFHATLRPYGEVLDDAPVYEFDVDLPRQLVRALPSTESALRGPSVAASGR